MENTEIFISVNESKIRTSDGYEYNLTPHFLYLYYYLALKRLHDPAGTGGYADTTEIISLPYWERNDLESIGKQIRRHIVEMEKEGRNIIEAQQKIKGPFRLILGPDRIKIDVPISRLMDVLDLRHIEKLTPEQETDFYKYVECMWEGNVAFDSGFLKEKALPLYKQASGTAINSELRLAALHKICVTLDRLGRYNEAHDICEAVLKIKGLDEIEYAAAYILLAWVKYRLREWPEAENLYHKGLHIIRGKRYYRLMGSIFSGLGLIHKGRKEYIEALAFYQRALEYWSLVDYFYGIQSVYFNIGNLYYLWGKQSQDMSNYREAIKWVNQCISLCERIHISYDTRQDYILLAGIHLRIGKLKEAFEYADTAKKMALSAGNKRDIGFSDRIFAKIYLKKGLTAKAEEAYKSCLEYLQQTDISEIELKEFEAEFVRLFKQKAA
ncbi:MAG: tetratricopeptide repeat protein [Desulfobacteraceae bacterium]|nr:tetratricopeptide repeat protein [Desulfobacteraceae bacterium]